MHIAARFLVVAVELLVTRAYQITLVDEQEHVLVARVLLDVLLQVPAPRPQRVPGIKHLHNTRFHEAN